MNIETIAGVNSYLLYSEETTYGTPVAATSMLGIITSFKPTVENNLSLRYGFQGTATTARQAVKTIAGTLDVSWSTDFDVQNFKFLKAVLGSSSGSNPIVYSPADSIPSLTLTNNINNPGSGATVREETYPGSVIESCNIRCATGEAVTCSLDGMSQKITYDAVLSTVKAISTDDVYTFAGASIQFPTGATLTNVIDSADITIKNNNVMLKGLGSRLTQRAKQRQLAYDIKFTLKYLDDTLINAALGSATMVGTTNPTDTTITMVFANGSRSATFTFTGVKINWGETLTQNEVITEDITANARTLSVSEVP